MRFDLARSNLRVPPCGATGKLVGLSVAAMLAVGAATAYAKGGTAKPPTNPPPPAGTPGAVATPVTPIEAPVMGTPSTAATVNGFGFTGMIQKVTCNTTTTTTGGTTTAPTAGGSVTVNGIKITVPTNMIVQYPANTLSWVDAMCPTASTDPGVVPPVALDLTGGFGTTSVSYPSTEISVNGNIVDGEYRAALITVSQQSLNAGSGYITSIDYTDGSFRVGSGLGKPDQVRLVINDPNGRFGRINTPDSRFSVDDQNPTIKAGATGYPMCIPRTLVAPTATADDDKCPLKNRPTATTANVANCRTFLQASGVPLPTGGDITPVGSTGFCSAFVMPGVGGYPGVTAATTRLATDPDPREQAPFKVGDYIEWGGTVLRGDGKGPNGSDTISVHTIDANVGIYTQPGTLPSYIAVGALNIGVDPFPTGTAVTVGAEATARLVVEAAVSDIFSVFDVYLNDKDPTTGADSYRWVTTESMTGTLAEQTAAKITPSPTSVQPFGGGITTQFTGPQAGRARIRAIKVPANGVGGCNPSSTTPGARLGCAVTASPTRTIKAVIRQLCAPATIVGTTAAPTNWYGINNTNPNNTPSTVLAPFVGASGFTNKCVERAPAANGLLTGQYTAPIGEFIFPENTIAGSPIVASNFWHLNFLFKGEGGSSGGSAGVMDPQPW
jgi:hypothetical protein